MGKQTNENMADKNYDQGRSRLQEFGGSLSGEGDAGAKS